MAKNVLWIMADQLRWDYLSCYGHPHLDTPNIDKLAERGVRFNKAYIQSPICGSSRMSYYTGRYTRSHGATWNFYPLRVGEPTLGDHLKRIGVRNVLAGKTHMIADTKGMEWLGIDPESDMGLHIAQCGFEPYDRDDGLHTSVHDRGTHYDRYLNDLGYDGDIPWHDWANSHEGDDGECLSGWLIHNNQRPARVPEEHSETAYMTNRAMAFMDEAGDQPWCLHLSYIKPHWPYVAPAPYHDMYGPETWLPFNRTDAEKENAQPVFAAFIQQRVCRAFSQAKVRDAMMAAYMGLIKQIDDHLGRLFAFMDEKGLSEDTMIVFCSDHGDYLGDHWMGEKDLFHDCSVRVPMIVADPSPAADATRGTVSEALVEGIDLAPTFVEYFGGEALPHILEGQSLMPLLHGEKTDLRDFAISEYDYATREARTILGQDHNDCRLIMCADKRWKYWHAEGHRPALYDLENDPNELVDLGESQNPDHVAIRALMHERIFEWARRHHNRITRTGDEIVAVDGNEPLGIIIGVWDEDAYEERFGHPFEQRP